MVEEEFKRPFETIDRLEEHASSLQTGLPVVATVVLVGGALVVDRTKLCGDGWRAALGASLGWVVVMLALATFFALLTTTRRASRAYPGEPAVVQLSTGDPAAERGYAVELLASARFNDRIRQWKLARMHSASFCVGLALLGFVAFAGILTAYGIARPACPTPPGPGNKILVRIPRETEHERAGARHSHRRHQLQVTTDR